jgi:carbon-monoxide dehydrogenase medium subunit
MYEFNYHKASSVDDAARAIAAAEDGKFLAGGQTLLPTMKQRLARPSDLVDLRGIAGLKKIAREGNMLAIGAMTTHATVAASDVVRKAIPALADLADGIGDAQVRNCGTIGGSVANNDPTADYPAALLALGATVKTNKREIPAASFFKGLFETALEAGELITEVRFPIPEKAAYAKFGNPASRYAIVGVFIAKTAGGIRVAVTGAGQNGVFLAADIEKALATNLSAKAVDGVTVKSSGLNGDIHASPEYRANLVKVMAKRAVAAIA